MEQEPDVVQAKAGLAHIDTLVDQAIKAAESLDSGLSADFDQQGQRTDQQRKWSPSSATSLNSSQMQTQVGASYLGYPYASTTSSSPAFVNPYSPHRSPAPNQYYSDNGAPSFQYAYHNRFYQPSYQYPPVNDPSMLYSNPRPQQMAYGNTQGEQGTQQQYVRNPIMQFYGMPAAEQQYYDPSMMEYGQPAGMVYEQDGAVYTPSSPESAFGPGYPQLPNLASPVPFGYQNQQMQAQSPIYMQSTQYAQAHLQPMYRPIPFAPARQSVRQPASPAQVVKPLNKQNPTASDDAASEPISPVLRPLPELARGHLAQANLHNAVWGRPAPLPHQYPEQSKRRSNSSIRNNLPKPPPHSDFALWAGNVPSDATHNELWRFFNSRPSPASAGVTSFPDPSLVTNPDALPDLRSPGVESIHLIARSNCCFVNYASQVHLDQALKASHGISLRPYDPRNKDLVCRVRKKGDDAKTGVGAQRGRGIHRQWAEDHPAAEEEKVALSTSEQSADYINHAEAKRQTFHRVSTSTQASTSTGTGSTSSSFLASNFAKRYFVLKSLSEEDLNLSVKNGLWATQSHNEPVLDQAYRTSKEGVFLIFSANKSGEFFGFAKMAGSITKLSSSQMTRNSDHSNTTSTESGSSLLKANMTILEGEAFNSPSPGIFSPSAPQVDSPQPETPGASNTSGNDSLHPAILAIKRGVSAPTGRTGIPDSGALAPRPAQSWIDAARKAEQEGTESLAERRGASLDPDDLATGKGGIHDLSVASHKEEEAHLKEEKDKSSSEEKQQALGGSSHHAEVDADGVKRKDTLLTPEERNAKLEALDDSRLANEKKGSGSSVFDKGWGRPFSIEWIKVQRLPFHRTRHLKNAFNQNREVKISRDGTELDPTTGDQLLQEFFHMSAPESPYKESFSGTPQ